MAYNNRFEQQQLMQQMFRSPDGSMAPIPPPGQGGMDQGGGIQLAPSFQGPDAAQMGQLGIPPFDPQSGSLGPPLRSNDPMNTPVPPNFQGAPGAPFLMPNPSGLNGPTPVATNGMVRPPPQTGDTGMEFRPPMNSQSMNRLPSDVGGDIGASVRGALDQYGGGTDPNEARNKLLEAIIRAAQMRGY